MTEPRLCADHAPVLDSVRDHHHVSKAAAREVAREYARQCPQCHEENR